MWPKRYAIWGGLVAAQPEQFAYCIVDAQTIRKFLAPAFKPYEAEAIEGLARACSLDPAALTKTVAEYNRATAGNGPLHIDVLDGNSTRDILPKKSNWALPIDHPPFYAFPLRPGITFTYMGVTVDETARILEQSGSADAECVRGGGDHVRKHFDEGLPGWFWPDHRIGAGRACWKERGDPCPSLNFSRKPIGN